MRFAILITAILASTCTFATTKDEPNTPRSIVFAYECKQIDPNKTGFDCLFKKDGLRLQWHEKHGDMPTEKREYARYEFNRITLRYLELGGSGFDVGFDFWNKNKVRHCSHIKGRPYYGYTCYNSEE